MRQLLNAAYCDHGELEPVADGVYWCPECGSQFAVSREQIERVHDLFMRKLAERYPNHPWLKGSASDAREGEA